MNGFSASIKRHRIANWVKNRTQPYVAYKETDLTEKIKSGLESKGRKKFSKQMDPIKRQE
jgi:hypothetical protein